jgi:glycosyltransferase involved in cell wall biosynthesis
MDAMQRAVLLITFQFPPFSGSSAVQRTLRFAKYLPERGWKPTILTVRPAAYESKSEAAGNEIPEGLTVRRVFAADAARHFRMFGYYPRSLAVPDRWITWKLFAVRAALSLIREHNICAIWSTFPIASAHAIGEEVARRSGLPWLAEFRDPMWQGDYPPDPRLNTAWKRLEERIFERASRIIVTTPSAKDLYAKRFSLFPQQNITVIQNGYDEEVFERASVGLQVGTQVKRIHLLHSGAIYTSERDPTQFFAAIAALKVAGQITNDSFHITLRATGNDKILSEELARLNIEDIVELAPSVDYLSAIREMMSVDGLIILQAANCNAQIPAKLYEYLRARKPILALTDPGGDTAAVLHQTGTGIIARLDDQADIQRTLLETIEQIKSSQWTPASDAMIASLSRQQQSYALAEVLLSVTKM